MHSTKTPAEPEQVIQGFGVILRGQCRLAGSVHEVLKRCVKEPSQSTAGQKALVLFRVCERASVDVRIEPQADQHAVFRDLFHPRHLLSAANRGGLLE